MIASYEQRQADYRELLDHCVNLEPRSGYQDQYDLPPMGPQQIATILRAQYFPALVVDTHMLADYADVAETNITEANAALAAVLWERVKASALLALFADVQEKSTSAARPHTSEHRSAVSAETKPALRWLRVRRECRGR